MGRSKVKGIGPLRRLMKRLPETMRGEMIVELNVEGREALIGMQAKVPRRRGTLSGALALKVFPKTLRLQVGVLRKKQARAVFYGHILNWGRKAQVVDVVRGGLSGAVRAAGGRSNSYKGLALRMGAKGAYKMRVRAIAATNFINDPAARLRARLRQELPKIYERALKRAAGGGVSD